MPELLIAAIFLAFVQTPTIQSQPGAVMGRLLGVDGAPAVGIRVAAVPAGGDNKTNSAVLMGIGQTDVSGRYRLEGIPPGRYYIFAGLIDFPNYYPGVSALARAASVLIEPGSTVSGVDFQMARPTTLKVGGRIVFPPGTQPPGYLTVNLAPRSPGSINPVVRQTVSSDGSFEFLQIPPGEYQLSSAMRGSSPINITVGDRDISDAILSVIDCNAGVKVAGRLAGIPSTPVRTISLTGSSSGCGSVTPVAADGVFTFTNAPEGVYRVQLAPSPLGWSPVNFEVARQDIDDVEIALPQSFEVKGHVAIQGGGDVPRLTGGAPAPIQASAMTGGQVTESILDDGSFKIRVVKGRYRISLPAIPPGYSVRSMIYGPSDLMREVLDVSGPPTEDIYVTLGIARPPRAGVRLSGRLNLPAASALPNPQRVVLVTSSGKYSAPFLETSVGVDGSFDFSGVPAGTYNLETYPNSPAAVSGIVVDRTDVTGIEFAVPSLVNVNGRIDWVDTGGAVLAAAPANVSVQFFTKNQKRLFAWAALAQDRDFHFYLPEGDYRFSVDGVPRNFDIDSVMSGPINILEEGLRVNSSIDPVNVRITLRARSR